MPAFDGIVSILSDIETSVEVAAIAAALLVAASVWLLSAAGRKVFKR